MPEIDLNCAFHETYDDDGPTGEACGGVGQFAVLWPETRQWSPACRKHSEDFVAAGAPPHDVQPIGEFLVEHQL